MPNDTKGPITQLTAPIDKADSYVSLFLPIMCFLHRYLLHTFFIRSQILRRPAKSVAGTGASRQLHEPLLPIICFLHRYLLPTFPIRSQVLRRPAKSVAGTGATTVINHFESFWRKNFKKSFGPGRKSSWEIMKRSGFMYMLMVMCVSCFTGDNQKLWHLIMRCN